MHQTTSLSSLHSSDNRYDFYYGDPPALVYDNVLRSWIVIDRQLAASALADRNFGAIDYRGANETLSKAAGIPLEAADFALAQIPIARDGPEHLAQRKAIAGHIASRRAALETGLRTAIEQCAARFRIEGQLDVMAEIVVPLANQTLASLAGVPIKADEPASEMSRVFDRLLGATRHRRIDAAIAIARSRIEKALGPTANDDQVGNVLAVWILGYDALSGTIGESLRRIFETNSGRSLAEITYPAMPPETGVPYVARRVLEDCVFGGAKLQSGDRVRVILQSSAYSTDPKHQVRMFGAGAHSCLGRPLTLDIWRLLTRELAGNQMTVKYLGSEMRDNDYLFIVPRSLRVELS